MSELISKSEFARRVGKSKQYINKLCKNGKLILHGKKLDFQESTESLQSTAATNNELREKFNVEQKGKGAKKAAEDRTEGKEDPGTDGRVNVTSQAMQKARLLAEINAAKIKEIEYKKAIGKLLPVEVVEAELAKVAEVVRAKLLSLPNRAAPRVMGMKTIPEIQDYLTGTVNEILKEFQDLAKTAKTNYEQN